MSEGRRKTVEIIYTIDFEKFYDYTRYVDVADMNSVISEVEARTIQKLKDKFTRSPAEIAVYASMAVFFVIAAVAVIYFLLNHNAMGGGSVQTLQTFTQSISNMTQPNTPIIQTITQIINGTTTTITTTITP